MKPFKKILIICIYALLICISTWNLTKSYYTKQINELQITNENLHNEIASLTGRDQLHHCPLCNSEDIELEHDDYWGYRVKCHGCFLSIWYYKSATEAITTWNSLTKEQPYLITQKEQK